MILTTIKGIELCFESAEGSFSPRDVDRGTLAMLSFVDFHADDKVLDLGCGYGVVGIVAAKFAAPQNVYLSDIHEASLAAARRNAALNRVDAVRIIRSNAYENIDTSAFTLILSNPPYHTDFSLAKNFIEKGFNRLAVGGRFFMVTKRKDWYKNKFIAIFGGVKIYEKDGYYIFEAEKRQKNYGSKGRK